MKRRSRTGVLFLIALLLFAVYLLRTGAIVIPEAWKPWVPLRIDDAPNLFTRWKLLRASGDPALCRSVLAGSGFRYTPVDDRETGPGCGFVNAVRIARTGVAVEPFTLSCRAALSLAMWERHVLQPQARRWLGSDVARIEHFGSYACRNVYGRTNASRSRHATADAFDISGFVLANGRRVRVVRDWASETVATADAGPETTGKGEALEAEGEGAAEAGFLRAVHRGACRYFDAVLGPDYNDAHADHFHVDRGGFRVCR